MHKVNQITMKKTSAFRRVCGDILLFLALAFTVYLSCVMLRRIAVVAAKGSYRTVFSREMIVCAVLILCAADIRFNLFTRLRAKWAKVAGWLIRALVIAASVCVLVLFGVVIVNGAVKDPAEADRTVVLGMALENGQPNTDLLHRVDTAAAWAKEHPGADVIVTGGNPGENGLTEAAVMRELLLERGIEDGRIILEDQASDTKQNFANVAKLIDPAEPIVLITSDYHMDRAAGIAKDVGFTHVLRRGAPSDPLNYGANVMWEVMMKIKGMLPKMRRPSR